MELQFEYDETRDLLTVEGQQYSGDLFRAWGKDGLPVGAVFRIVKRADGEPLTVERLLPEMTPEQEGRFWQTVAYFREHVLEHGRWLTVNAWDTEAEADNYLAGGRIP